MSYKVIVELNLKNGKVQEFFKWCKYVCEATREADGCLKIETGIAQNDHRHAFIIQEWKNFQSYKGYFFDLEKTGAWRSLISLIQREPKITLCNFSEV